MRRATIALVGLLVTVLAGCGNSVRTLSEFDENTDFSKIHTYAWRKDGGTTERGADAGSPSMTAMSLQSIRAAIEATLAEKGLKRGEPADMLVDFRAGTRDRLRTTFWGRNPYLYGPRPDRDGFWPIIDRRTVETFEESVLAIDMFDPQGAKPIWSGIGATVLSFNEADKDEIKDAVGEILKDFPPGVDR